MDVKRASGWGPLISASAVIEVDAYDKIAAVIPHGSVETTVNVQPGDGAQFLLITASSYTNLTYKVDAGGTVVTLNGPHIFIGSGAVDLLGPTQNALKFTNSHLTEDRTVIILVGRDATP